MMTGASGCLASLAPATTPTLDEVTIEPTKATALR